jgi:high-affinity nickel-transport protein
VDINTLGFIIMGLFVAVWLLAVGVWRFGKVEQRWSARLADDGAP